MFFDSTVPSGSPLSPATAPEFLKRRDATMGATPFEAPTFVPDAATMPQLPKAPPTKKPTIWDKEHISETLASIGAGFFGSQNFGDGLGAAAQTIAGRTRQLREEERPDISYGGPGDQFEISTDRRTGARTIREVPQFRAANERATAAKGAPSATDKADLRARALYAISTQIAPEQRAAAYQRLITHPEQFGIDATGMPAEWDDGYGTMGGMMGMNVNQSLNQTRADALAKDTMRHRQVQEGQGAQRVQQGEARVAQGAQRTAASVAKLRAPPSSVRKGYTRVGSRAEYDALPKGSKYIAPDGSQRIKS